MLSFAPCLSLYSEHKNEILLPWVSGGMSLYALFNLRYSSHCVSCRSNTGMPNSALCPYISAIRLRHCSYITRGRNLHSMMYYMFKLEMSLERKKLAFNDLLYVQTRNVSREEETCIQ